MAKGDNQKKVEYFERTRNLFREHNRIFVVTVDNVTSSQMHQVRGALRGKATILMGKNTMVKKAMKEVILENPKLEAMLPYIRGNIGLVFTNDELKTVRDIVIANKVEAAAKVGLVAQNDVVIPAGNTGIDPSKTSFFQALSINTKVVKGAVEIVSDVVLLRPGQKVGASEAALLNMLNITPFSFSLGVQNVYDDGSIFSPSILDITEDVMVSFVKQAIKNVASVSLAAKFPTVASAPHLMVNAYKNLISTGLGLEEYSFPALDKFKQSLACAAAAPVVAAASSAPAAAAAAAPPAEESEEDDMGFGLFD